VDVKGLVFFVTMRAVLLSFEVLRRRLTNSLSLLTSVLAINLHDTTQLEVNIN
jgi:hypothetical protein